MLPFINIFGLSIPMYGVMIATGVGLGAIAAIYFPAKKTIPRQDIFFAFCYAAVGTFIGAKLLYIITIFPGLISSIRTGEFTLELAVNLIRYGFIFYGGIIGAIAAVFIYSKKYKLSFIDIMEILIVSVPLIHAVGRIGCFCAGCCYGHPVDPPWGLFFKAGSAAPFGISLFPIQLMESGINAVLFIAIFIFSRHRRKAGQLLGFYFAGYGVERFILEYFRYDQAPILLGLSLSQIISLILIPIGVILLIKPGIFIKSNSDTAKS